MDSTIQILVGTTTGNAQYVAEEAQFNLQQAGFEARIVPMDGIDRQVFAAGGVFLLCVSTYGYGDVPANAKPLYESLVKDKPDLSTVRYGIVSLGDSSHAQTFCFAGRRFDQILSRLGATRIGGVLNHDASSGVMPEEAAAAWVVEWARELAGATTA